MKMNRWSIVACALAGILTAGPAALAAELPLTQPSAMSGQVQSVGTVEAQPSAQNFYLKLVTRHPLDLRAYVIAGNNFVQLRDLGRACDFSVSYLSGQNLVVVDGISPYKEDPNQMDTAFVAPGISVTATPTAQKFNFNGQLTELTAYTIHGHNYVKLRDVGRALDFRVTYDSADNSVTIDRTLPYEEEPEVPTPETPKEVPDGVVVIPQSDENFILKEGDKVLCDDGTIYEITDMSRFDKSMFAAGPLPPLPTPTCDWSQFPDVELPKVEVKRVNDNYGDDLFVLNLYETRRMQYTIYNLAGANLETWDGNGIKLSVKGNPIVSVSLTIRENSEPQVFWPWKESNISNLFNSRPVSSFCVQAWDHYMNGRFLETRYKIQSF